MAAGGMVGIAAALLFVTACSQEKDSAMVEAESRTVAATSNESASGVESWAIDTTNAVRIGGHGHVFGGIAGGTILPDGRMLIADQSDVSVRIFDKAGTLSHTAVMKGGGPAEREGVSGLLGDSFDTLYADDAARSTFVCTWLFSDFNDNSGRPARPNPLTV